MELSDQEKRRYLDLRREIVWIQPFFEELLPLGYKPMFLGRDLETLSLRISYPLLYHSEGWRQLNVMLLLPNCAKCQCVLAATIMSLRDRYAHTMLGKNIEDAVYDTVAFAPIGPYGVRVECTYMKFEARSDHNCGPAPVGPGAFAYRHIEESEVCTTLIRVAGPDTWETFKIDATADKWRVVKVLVANSNLSPRDSITVVSGVRMNHDLGGGPTVGSVGDITTDADWSLAEAFH